MFNFLASFLLFVAVGGRVTGATQIMEILAYTSDIKDAGTDDHVAMTFYPTDGGICIDEHLDTPYNDFERGHVDSFTGAQLRGCHLWEFTGGIEQVVVEVKGGDAWQWEKILVFTDDGKLYGCEGGLSDNSESIVVQCSEM